MRTQHDKLTQINRCYWFCASIDAAAEAHARHYARELALRAARGGALTDPVAEDKPSRLVELNRLIREAWRSTVAAVWRPSDSAA